MKSSTLFRTAALSLSLSGLMASAMIPMATAMTDPTPGTVSNATQLKTVIANSDAAIVKRENTVKNQTADIAAMKHLTDANKKALTDEIATDGTKLTALKATIDKETSLTKAQAEYHSIFTDYRVYLLVIPQIKVTHYADIQQDRATHQIAWNKRLQAYVDKQTGSQKTTLSAKLKDANAQSQAALKLAQTYETNALKLVPNDYNKDHALMVTYLADIQKAHTQLGTAYQELTAVQNTLQHSQQSYLNFLKWGVKLPISGGLASATYQDITKSYSLPYSTVMVRVTGQPAASTCKGGVVGWIQRVPDTINTGTTLGSAHIGSFNYVSHGVQDCAVQGPEPTLAKQFDQAVSKMVAE